MARTLHRILRFVTGNENDAAPGRCGRWLLSTYGSCRRFFVLTQIVWRSCRHRAASGIGRASERESTWAMTDFLRRPDRFSIPSIAVRKCGCSMCGHHGGVNSTLRLACCRCVLRHGRRLASGLEGACQRAPVSELFLTRFRDRVDRTWIRPHMVDGYQEPEGKQ